MKMNRWIAMAVSALASGCYEFEFPLDAKPEVIADERLLGGWRCMGLDEDAKEPPFSLHIAKKSGTTTSWAIESVSSDGKVEGSAYEAFGSTLRPGKFLNLREVGEKDPGKWTFLRYSFLLPQIMRVELIKDEPFEKIEKSQKAIRSAIEKRRNDPAIYSEFCICVRSKAKPGAP